MADESSSRDDNSEFPNSDMFVHMEEAKKRHQEQEARSSSKSHSSLSSLQRIIKKRSDCAVLASNHERRLKETEDNDAITHRSNKRWTSAKIGVDTHGRLPIYYRLDGLVTHGGYISKIVIDPSENEVAAKEFLEHIGDDDDYGEYNDELDTTTYIVTEGRQLENPFPQSQLRKIADGKHIKENYSYQPAYVFKRPGDFPNSK